MKLYDELKDDSGMVVVLQLKIGEIFVFVSVFFYDLNGFIFGWSDKEWKKLNEDKNNLFLVKFNKIYVLGFMIKLIVVVIGIKNGILKVDEKKIIKGKEW